MYLLRGEMDRELLIIFKALADENRHRMLEILCEQGELCVSEICKNFEMTQPSVSHHLAILRRAGVVQGRKIGKEVYYSIDKIRFRKCFSDYIEELSIIFE